MKNYLLLCLFLCSVGMIACQPETGEEDAASSPQLSIVAQDSLYVITVNNYTIDPQKSSVWTLDGVPQKIIQQKEQQFIIPNKSIKAGKHNLVFVQGETTLNGTIYKIEHLNFSVQLRIPHRSDLFTEGFFFDDNENLWESSGLDGKSKLFKMHWNGAKWQILDSLQEKEDEFGEGISLLNGELVHLYWKNQYLKIFDANPLKLKSTLAFEGEGWGLCNAGTDALWVSNGSSQLRKMQINKDQLLTLKTINVSNDLGPVSNLNELEEWNENYIWANIWQSDHIVLIDQNTGLVVGDLDLSSIAVQERAASFNAEVLNGIAWHKKDQTLWVTGKYWKNIYILKLNNLP